MHNYW